MTAKTGGEPRVTKRGLLFLVVTVVLALTPAPSGAQSPPPDEPCVPPTAEMKISENPPYVGEPVTFTDISEPQADVTHRHWSLGDGTNATTRTVEHTYLSGKYTVELEVWGACEHPTVHALRISVVPRPQVVGAPEGPPEGEVTAPMTPPALVALGLLAVAAMAKRRG